MEVGVEGEIVDLVVNNSFETHDMVRQPPANPLILAVVSKTKRSAFWFNNKHGPTGVWSNIRTYIMYQTLNIG